jgi:predicted CoA-binding protein
LGKYKVVAVVGLSKEPEKDSHGVSAYLKQHGYRIIPVNPLAD